MRVLVTGSNGLVGSAIAAEAATSPHEFVFATRADADLTEEGDVSHLFERVKPDAVLHTAARVGGVQGNLSSPGDYFRENILMNAHVIHYAAWAGVKKLLAFSSVCVFPEGIPVLREDRMHDGPPFEGNFAYGYAKRMVDVQIRAYKKQFGVGDYASIVPGNIFGEHDLYNLTHGHVLPCLIHKVYLAKKNGTPLHVWGDGTPRREFIYARDLARNILKILDLPEIPERVIISGDRQTTIREIVERLCRAANFVGDVVWETDKPNGQHARPTDLSVLRGLVGDPGYTDLDAALKASYDWFEANYEAARK